jgi:HlyD family secretion protein
MATKWVLLAGAAVFGLLGAGRADEAPPKQPPALEFKGYLTPVQRVLVASRVPGQVVEVLVREGQRVKKGDLLARLDRAQQQAGVRQGQARVERAKARLAQLQAGPRAEDVKRAEADVREAQALAKIRETAATTAKQLLQRGTTPEQEVVKAETAYQAALAQLKKQEAVLAALKAGPPADQVRVAQAEVAVAQAQLEQAHVQLDRTDVRAPFAGTVLKLHVGVGSFTNPAATGLASAASICDFADLSALEVEVHVHERNLSRFFKGQKCEVRLDAFPGTTYRGVVERLFPVVDRGTSTFTLWVKPEMKKDHNLPVDASATVRFAPRVRE